MSCPRLLHVAIALSCLIALAPSTAHAQYYGPIQDGAGYGWDISQGGAVGDGTSDAFDGGFNLMVDEQSYYGMAQPSPGSSNEMTCQEQDMSGVRVSRRVTILQDPGCCRWLDTFENSGQTPVTITVTLQSNQGSDSSTQLVACRGGDSQDQAGPGTLAVLTDDYADSGDPAVIHIFAAERASVIPTSVSVSGDNVRADFQIEIPARSRRILVFFGVQRNARSEILEILDAFDARAALADLDPETLRDIVNFRRGSGFAGVPSIDLPERTFTDQLVVRSGDRLVGTVRTEMIPVAGALGRIEVPIAAVAGFALRVDDDLGDGVLLETGEILRGRVDLDAIRFGLSSGQTLTIPIAEVGTLACRQRGGEQVERPDRRLVVLRSGDLLFGSLDPRTPVRLRTPYGLLSFPVAEVALIEFEPDDGVQHVNLMDGASFSGIVDAAEVAVVREGGAAGPQNLSIPVYKVARYGLAGAVEPAESTVPLCQMRNGDTFRAMPRGPLVLETRFGDVEVEPRQLRAIQCMVEPPGQVTVTLWDGATISGTLKDDRLHLDRGTTEIVIGAVAFERIDCPAPEVPQAVADRVYALIDDLGASDPQVRMRAREELSQLGSAILPLLRQARNHPDIEVRAALEDVIRRIESQR